MLTAPPPAPAAARRSRSALLIHWSGTAGLAALVLGTLLAWSARWFWVGEIATSFTWHLGLVSLAAALSLGLARRPRLAATALILAGVHLAPELALELPAPDTEVLSEEPASLTIATCNLLWRNRRHAQLLAWIGRVDPDIVAFQEVSPRWRRVLESLSASYPTLLLSPPAAEWNRGTWGTAILARVPAADLQLIPPPDGIFRPLMQLTTVLAGEPLVLRSAHPIRPGRAWRTHDRNVVLDLFEEQDWTGNSLLLGDLNVTSTSPAFTDLLQATGLRDSRAGFGRQPTYTTNHLIPGLSIAIDHVLVSAGLDILERRTEDLPGSDHRNVIVRLAARSTPGH